MESMLKVTNLSYSYPAEKEQVLKNISFDVKKNETFSIIGPSGCGKTTLALTLNGLIPNSIKGKLTGEIVVVGKKIKDIPTAELAQEVQILFQSPESQLFALNVEDEISFGLENLNIPWDEIKKRIDNILKKLDIENLRNSSIEELSSGQKQKVAMASVLVMNPKILILDEPTANIDPCSVRNFINLLENMKKDLTIIIVEHNLDFVKELSDRVMLVNNGRLVKIARPEVMFKDKTFLKIMSPPSDKKGMLRRIAAKAHIRECGEKEERILNIKNLNFKYPNNVPALRDVNLAVNKGDFIGIVGLNGSGKSTLALNIIGLLNCVA